MQKLFLDWTLTSLRVEMGIKTTMPDETLLHKRCFKQTIQGSWVSVNLNYQGIKPLGQKKSF